MTRDETTVDAEGAMTLRTSRLRPLLQALSKLPPCCVVWGDGSSDEMCLGLLIATFGSP
jgi:hypothetical protein